MPIIVLSFLIIFISLIKLIYTMIYGYIRVSSDKQTVENQRFEIGNFCEKNNLTIDV